MIKNNLFIISFHSFAIFIATCIWIYTFFFLWSTPNNILYQLGIDLGREEIKNCFITFLLGLISIFLGWKKMNILFYSSLILNWGFDLLHLCFYFLIFIGVLFFGVRA